MRKNFKKSTKRKKIKNSRKSSKKCRIYYTKRSKKKTLKKSIQSGGKGSLVFHIPPFHLDKLRRPVEIINTLLNQILTSFLNKIIVKSEQKKSIDNIINNILNNDFKYKIRTISGKIVNQIEYTILVAYNTIISFIIPIPPISGLIRTANSSIYGAIQTRNHIKEFIDLKNEIIKKLEQDGIEIEEISMTEFIKEMYKEFKHPAKNLELSQELSQATGKIHSLQSQATGKMQSL